MMTMRGLIIACVLVGVCMQASKVDAATSYAVYGDSLNSPFQDWSWARVSVVNTNVHAGTAAVSFLPVSWNAYYLHATDFIDTNTYTGLEFYIWRPVNSSTNILFNMVVDGSSGGVKTGPSLTLASLVPGGVWTENVWLKATVTFNGVFPSGVFDGFWFQDNSGLSTNLAVQIDDIVLTSGTSSSSTTSAPTSTTTKAPSTTTTTKAPSSTTTTKAPSSTTTTTKSPTTAAPSTSTTKAPTTTTTTTRAPTTTTTTTQAPTTGDVDSEVLALYNTVTVGQSTYYGQYTNGGECMLDPLPDSGKNAPVAHTVAIANYMLSRTCGMCLQVTGNGKGSGDPKSAVNGTRIVFVNNECPNCPIGNLDFGLNGDGVWDTTYKAVPCPVTTKIQYVFKDGSSPYWMGLQARNTVYPVYKFGVKVAGVWTYMPRFSYNYFIASFSNLQFPIQIQLTSVKGEVITDTIQSIQNGVIVNGNAQFTP